MLIYVDLNLVYDMSGSASSIFEFQIWKKNGNLKIIYEKEVSWILSNGMLA